MKVAVFYILGIALIGFTGWVAAGHFGLVGSTQDAGANVSSDSLRSNQTVDAGNAIEGIGFVEPVSEVHRLSFKFGGVIANCFANVGETVAKGTRLVELANSGELIAVEVAEEELKLAHAEEARVLRGVHEKRVEAAREKISSLSSRMDYLQREVERLRSLSQSSVSRSELQRIEAEWLTSLADHRAAAAEVAHLETFVLDEDKQIAAQRVRLAEAKLKQLRDKVRDTVLLAPFDGTVLEVLHREGEGVTVEQREPVLLFADLSRRRVRAEIDERHVHQLHPGLHAMVYGKNVGDRRFKGRVALVKAIMGDKTVFARTATERKDLDTLQVFIEMPADFDFPTGLRVDVSIHVLQESHHPDPTAVARP